MPFCHIWQPTTAPLPQSPCPYFLFFCPISPLVLTNVHYCQLFKPTPLSDLSKILKGHHLPLSFNFHFHFSLLPFHAIHLSWALLDTLFARQRALTQSTKCETGPGSILFQWNDEETQWVKDITRACCFSVFQGKWQTGRKCNLYIWTDA